MSWIDWLGVALIVPALIVLLRRLNLREWKSLDDHIESALRQANSGRRCDCGGRLHDASGVEHTPTRCQPLREATTRESRP